VESFKSVEAKKDFFLHLREKRRNFSQGWIMKDYDSRRYWIGGEGLPSRDQVKEKRE
jgi:hypothetical protein